MSEPPIPPPPPPPPPPGRPFTGEPQRAPGGCGRPLLVGCGVVAVLLGLGAIVFLAKAKDLLAWTLGELREQVVVALPADVQPEERRRLDRGFEAALDRIRAGQVETPALYALQRQLMNAAEKSQAKTLTRDDVLDLLSALERVGGLLPSGEEAAPGGPAAAGPSPPGSP